MAALVLGETSIPAAGTQQIFGSGARVSFAVTVTNSLSLRPFAGGVTKLRSGSKRMRWVRSEETSCKLRTRAAKGVVVLQVALVVDNLRDSGSQNEIS